MPQFIYTARDPSGKTVQGEIRARTEEDARAALRRRRMEPLRIHPARRHFSYIPFVTKRDLAVFCRQLALMINAGVPVVQALEVLAEHVDKKRLYQAIVAMRQDVEAGETFAEAARKHRKLFDEVFLSTVEVGESSGNLVQGLNRVAEYYEKIHSLRMKVFNALLYPAIIITFAVGALLFLLVSVIPTFARIYESFGAKLPALTRAVIGVSNFLIHNSFWVLVAFAIALVFFFRAKSTPQGKLWWDRLRLRLPVFGSLVRKAAIARFARTLAVMVQAGVPILDALEITARTAGNRVVEIAVLRARREISAGKNLADPLRESGAFPPMVVHMVSVGEETGRLTEMLAKVADFFEEDVDRATEALTTVIEPIMLIVIGGIIGLVIISMYLPIFDLITVIQ